VLIRILILPIEALGVGLATGLALAALLIADELRRKRRL
jgi:hypothetical protein